MLAPRPKEYVVIGQPKRMGPLEACSVASNVESVSVASRGIFEHNTTDLDIMAINMSYDATTVNRFFSSVGGACSFMV